MDVKAIRHDAVEKDAPAAGLNQDNDRLIEAMIFSDDVALCDRFRALFETLRQNPGNMALTPGWLHELPLQLQVMRWLSRPLQRWM